MEHSDLLLTTAEVPIAFAGFASLVTPLGRRSAEQMLLLDVGRLRGMILCSLLALAFSLLPFLPYALGAPPQVVWRISSGLLFLAASAILWVQLRYLKRTGWTRAPSLYVNLPLALLALSLLAEPMRKADHPSHQRATRSRGVRLGAAAALILSTLATSPACAQRQGTAGLPATSGGAPAKDAGLAALADTSAVVAPAAQALALAAAEPDPVVAALLLVGGVRGSHRVRLESNREATEGPAPVTVIVVREGFLDDSVWGDWHRVELSPAPDSRGWQVTSFRRAIRCWPGRGAERWRDQICR